MRVVACLVALMFSSVSLAGVMPWGIKSKLSLGLEKEDLPYMPEDAEKHYDLGLELSNGYGLMRGVNSEWKVKYLYEKWPDLDLGDRDSVGHTYRLEYHLHF